METKKCTICNKELSIENFNIRYGKEAHLRRNQCKKCYKFKQQEYFKSDHGKAIKKAWYEKNPDFQKAWSRNYDKNNEHRKIYIKNYRKNNKERIYFTIYNWNKNNPNKYKAIQYRREAKRRGVEGNHTPLEIKELFLKQGGRCICCKINLKKASYHRDHIIPIAKGGNDFIHNIQLLCPKCNMEKRDKDSIVFMQIKGYLL